METADTRTEKQKAIEVEEFDSYQIDSDILLSKIEYDEIAPQSPQINYNMAEAKIKQLTETVESYHPFKKSKPYCGCGNNYSCTSSLYLHIRSKHYGKPPEGTIGGPKGIVKKPPTQQPVVKVEEEPVPNGYPKFAKNTQENRVIPNPNPKPNNESKEQEQPKESQTTVNASLDRSRMREQKGKKICKLCGKDYSCNSSLNLHLKRKHLIRKTQDGRTEYSPRMQDKTSHQFECLNCGLSYGSKSALGLHYNLKHSSKAQHELVLPYGENKAQKCGCGLVYQSRSALNMHVKKKHSGNYPQGTTEKPNLRGQNGSYRDEKLGINRIEKYLIRNQQNSSGEEQQSIYDSESDERNRSKVNNNVNTSKQSQDVEKPYRCGCGRTYSCSSSLNLHIKKNHNWIVPEGTIGGPRGMRHEDEKDPKSAEPPEQEMGDKMFTCSQCNRSIDGSFFQCKSCESHQKCSKCFWGNHKYSEQHEWEVRKHKG